MISVTPDEPVPKIASVMADNHIHTLPVMEDGKLVGIIGKLDEIKAMIQDWRYDFTLCMRQVLNSLKVFVK